MKTIKCLSFSILFGLLLCIAPRVHAQATIGSGLPANEGALLDLKQNNNAVNSTKGLGIPRVKLTTLNSITTGDITGVTDANKDDHIGLVVYNIYKQETQVNRICPGIHVWDGTAWLPLVPYSPIREANILTGAKTKAFEYLDPSSPAGWPADKEADRLAGKYDLGRTGLNNTNDFADTRESVTEVYPISRFYVGYLTTTYAAEVRKSYVCDASANPNYIATDPIVTAPSTTSKVFEDGVWMTENLRARALPPGSAGTFPPAAGTYHPDGVTSINKRVWFYPSKTANQASYTSSTDYDANPKLGLFYNWALAINLGTGVGQSPQSYQMESTINENPQRQGICPAGWHLPSARQWYDLENAIALKTHLFSSAADIGLPLKAYDNYSAGSVAVAKAMQSKTQLATEVVGTSKTAAAGGFDALCAGEWTISYTDIIGKRASMATSTQLQYEYDGFITLRPNSGVSYNGAYLNYTCHSVRCMRNTTY